MLPIPPDGSTALSFDLANDVATRRWRNRARAGIMRAFAVVEPGARMRESSVPLVDSGAISQHGHISMITEIPNIAATLARI